MRTNPCSTMAALVVGLCLGLPGCRTEQKAAAPDDDSATARAAVDAAVAPVKDPEELLPASTVVFAVGKSPRRAAEVFGRDRIAERFPDLYQMAAGFSTTLAGRDLLDPDSLPAMGIAPDGRAGFAVVSIDPEALAFFVTLADPALFRETVIQIASRHGGEVVPTSYGGAEVLRDASGSAAVVIRGDFGVLVVGNRGEQVPQVAQALATVDPSRALAGTRAYRRTLGATAPGDLVSFIDVAKLVAQNAARRESLAGELDGTPSWVERELEEARASGASPERIEELEGRAREQSEWDARWRKRQEAEAALADLLFSPIEGVALRVDAKPSGAIFEVRMPMAEDAFLRRLVREGSGAPPLSWALDGAPLAMLSGNVDMATFVELVDQLARAEGTSFAELTGELRSRMGVDLEALTPSFTGMMGGAITLEGEPDLAALDAGPPKWLGLTVHAELTDPAPVEAMLGALAGKVRPFGKPAKREPGLGGFSFEAPSWRRVYVAVAGRHLVVTTDPLLPERLARGKAGNVDKKTKPSGAYAAMSLPDTAVTYAADMAVFGWLLFSRSAHEHAVASVESPETESIPKSRSWQKKNKELEAARARLRKARESRDAVRAKVVLDAVRSIGITVVAAREEEQGLWATGGQFVRAEGIAGAVVEVIAGTQGLGQPDASPESRELERLLEETSRLEHELQEIRQADIDRVRNRKKR